MKIAVTGSSGYIGECFVRFCSAAGHRVVALSRAEPLSADCQWIPYALESKQAIRLPAGTDVVFHLATNTSSIGEDNSAREQLAVALLIEAAERVGAKFVFMSSQTARCDAPTSYGRTKWAIEQTVLDSRGKVIRPGQVYGGAPRGLFGELARTVQRAKMLPAFLPAPFVQPIHVEDLAYGMLRIADSFDECPNIVRLASPELVSFTSFLRSLACDRLRTFRLFVPVPAFLVLMAVRLFGKRTRFSRLMSLFDLPPMDAEADLRSIGLSLRPLVSGMHLSGSARRRNLFLEGRALLCYVMKQCPSNVMLRNYVSVIEDMRGGLALGLPASFLRCPLLLAIVDRGPSVSQPWMGEFVWRLNAATVLAEASTVGARRFLGIGQERGFVAASLELARAVLVEACFRVLSVLLRPLTRVALPHSWAKPR